jgi:hypothetical protein
MIKKINKKQDHQKTRQELIEEIEQLRHIIILKNKIITELEVRVLKAQ